MDPIDSTRAEEPSDRPFFVTIHHGARQLYQAITGLPLECSLESCCTRLIAPGELEGNNKLMLGRWGAGGWVAAAPAAAAAPR